MATKHKVKRYNGEEDGSEVEVGAPMRRGEVETTDIPPMAEEAAAPAKAAPAKAKMVTKEELAKSGLSLRDYLNKQQGLTRRGEPKSEPKSTSPAVEAVVAKRSMPAPSPSRSGMLTRMREADKGIKGVRGTEATPSAPRAVTKINPEDLKKPMKGMGGASGFANGGSVSRRGDGIASKGKTRGRMC
jgi:pyruvate/2-oxoglutarate dehydrogenase complex dihydrolipoamide acyltransferase (E2) component